MRMMLPRGARGWLAVLALATLGCAGAALADPGASTVATVSATFAAAPVGTVNVQTCTATSGDTFQFANATYSGNATGTIPNLTGTIRIDVQSVYDSTKNLGWVQGHVELMSTTAGDHADGHFTAVNVAGTLQGFLTGNVGDPGMHLLGNLTSGFTATGGFTGGTFGAGSATNTAITITPGGCGNPGHGDDDADDQGGPGNGHGPDFGAGLDNGNGPGNGNGNGPGDQDH